jgi:CheY-like chemotaxis protein
MSKRVLVVDDDLWVQRMVRTVLIRRGHEVETADDGQHALKVAFEFQPDLIITDVMMPGMNGWTFVRALRSHKEMALVPVIFLTGLDAEEDRIMGFRLGADDYLPKPFRFEELDLRVEKVLRSSQRMREQVEDMSESMELDAGVGLSGDLAHMGVSSILTFLEMEKKSGILVIKGKETGRIFFRDGQPMSASFDARREPKGAEVVFQMLTWGAGKFSFTTVEVDMEDQIQTSTTHLLLEGARRIDEATRE